MNLTAKSRSEIKRASFRELFINACKNEISYDEIENQIDRIASLRERHIMVVRFFYRVKGYEINTKKYKKIGFSGNELIKQVVKTSDGDRESESLIAHR